MRFWGQFSDKPVFCHWIWRGVFSRRDISESPGQFLWNQPGQPNMDRAKTDNGKVTSHGNSPFLLQVFVGIIMKAHVASSNEVVMNFWIFDLYLLEASVDQWKLDTLGMFVGYSEAFNDITSTSSIILNHTLHSSLFVHGTKDGVAYTKSQLEAECFSFAASCCSRNGWSETYRNSIVIKGSLGGETSVLRTFRMSGK